MKRAGATVLVLIGAAGLFWLLWPVTGATPAVRTPPSAPSKPPVAERPTTAHIPVRALPPVAAALYLALESAGPTSMPLSDEHEWIVFDRSVSDPVLLAAQVSLVLTEEGYRRRGDRSRAGRTVLTFEKDGAELVVAVGRLTVGAFVAAAVSPEPGAWIFGPDEVAPDALRLALPPPAPVTEPETKAQLP